MGYRLTRIYTKTGDKGTTGLGDGQRVEKDSARIEAIGSVDELNSLIGILLSLDPPPESREILTGVQHRLFDIGGELAMPAYTALTDEDVERLEQQLDRINQQLPPLEEFILPGGTPLAAHCHHARTVCRRAERRVTTLTGMPDETLNPVLMRFLNRLSDLLFVMSRQFARMNGGAEIFWSKEK